MLQTAGIQSIPYEVYDAAKVDGASGPQTLVYITFPHEVLHYHEPDHGHHVYL